MEQQVMKFMAFITGGNSASVSNMCRAAVFIMAVFISGAVGMGPVYGRLSNGDGWSPGTYEGLADASGKRKESPCVCQVIQVAEECSVLVGVS